MNVVIEDNSAKHIHNTNIANLRSITDKRAAFLLDNQDTEPIPKEIIEYDGQEIFTSIGQTFRTLEPLLDDDIVNQAALQTKVLYLIDSKAAREGKTFLKTICSAVIDQVIMLPNGKQTSQLAFIFHDSISTDAQLIIADLLMELSSSASSDLPVWSDEMYPWPQPEVVRLKMRGMPEICVS